ncbi:unnamed protein product [Leuciscus chuanchicus]
MAFGSAQIALMEEEFGWVTRFLQLKDQLPGGPTAKYLFFTSTQNPCKNLNCYFQEAWKSMGLPGCPTFTDVRTSIASHIKFTHNNDDRVKLSKFMCHDTRTADKFYVANLTPQQAMELRRLFDAALEGAERGSPSMEPTSGKRPAKGKGKQPLKRRAPESPDEELTSGSTTPEGTRMELQESGASSPESSEHGEEEASEKGSQDEQEPQEPSTPPRKYPARRGKATVLLTPLKSLGSSQKLVSPLKVKKAIFSASSTTLVGINRRKKAAEKVKAAMNRRRKPK